MTPAQLAAEVLNELRALHYSSHGNGATTPEILHALRVRGIGRDEVLGLDEVVGRLHDAGHLRPKRGTPPETYAKRAGRLVFVPNDHLDQETPPC